MKIKFVLTFVIFIIFHQYQNVYCQSIKHTLSGFIREKGSRETLIGVNVYFPQTRTGTISNTYGFYSITLPADTYQVTFSYVGYQSRNFSIDLTTSDVNLNVDLDYTLELSEVVITADKFERISESPHMSVIEIPVRQVKSIPALLGEKDVLKVIQLMPGVQKGSEGSSGLYVRGGGADQNLIILDDATVYNAYHLFGFFSLFNGDAIKSIQLIKGGFSSRYGGRLSSVLDINLKDGNRQKYSGEAGIGLISSRLLLEGPIIKDKSSFIVSGRRTYLDALIAPFMTGDEKGGYYFYDLNAKINYDIDDKNKLFLSGYFGKDKFYFKYKDYNSETEAGLFWDNSTATLRWNHLFNNKMFANTSFIFSNYRLNIYIEEKIDTSKYNLSYSSGIRDFGLKYDFEYHYSPTHTFRAGLISTNHLFTPSAVVLKDDYLNEFKSEISAINTLESAVYIEDEIKIKERTKLNIGLRASHFLQGKKSYFNPEPRLSAAYLITDDLAAKASYSVMNQSVHLLSNTGLGLPTDLWVPSTDNIPPQNTYQIAAGLAKDVVPYNFSISLEGYYKKSKNTLGYVEGASFLLIDDPSEAGNIDWEQNITQGQSWSYGTELLLQRKTGRLSGWIGYTLSWTELQFDNVNFGKRFYARYDRRHDVSVVGIFEITDKITCSSTWVYGTGNAITMPLAEYNPVPHMLFGDNDYYGNGNFFYGSVNEYGEKNSFRMAPYHRLDIGIQFHKQMPKYERTFEFSIYNVYNRQNPYFYFIGYDDRTNSRVLKQISLFPIIPSVSWNIKF
ncbi:MAG: TonB-dependent receptor [Bacteroidales bacterium]|nr:TonB-dependent receptor [Bacteroidales bacterium]